MITGVTTEPHDIIDGETISINGTNVYSSTELIDFVQANADLNLSFFVNRDGQNIRYEITPNEGRVGVYLSELMNYSERDGFSVYNANLISSVLEIKEEKYPWLAEEIKAIRKAIDELKMPFMGICLGHQLLADALRGKCAPQDPPEIGIFEVKLTKNGKNDAIFKR